MLDDTYQPLGCLDGAEVGVQSSLNSQDILIRHSDSGQSLACLFGFGKADIIRREDAYYWRIAHDNQVDDLLVELIDLLISIRYAHPAIVQLELALPVPSTSTALSVDSAEESDNEGMILEPDEP